MQVEKTGAESSDSCGEIVSGSLWMYFEGGQRICGKLER